MDLLAFTFVVSKPPVSVRRGLRKARFAAVATDLSPVFLLYYQEAARIAPGLEWAEPMRRLQRRWLHLQRKQRLLLLLFDSCDRQKSRIFAVLAQTLAVSSWKNSDNSEGLRSDKGDWKWICKEGARAAQCGID
jgi:hypothetical protein